MTSTTGSDAWWESKQGPEWVKNAQGNYEVTFWWRDPAGTEATSRVRQVWIYINGVTYAAIADAHCRNRCLVLENHACRQLARQLLLDSFAKQRRFRRRRFHAYAAGSHRAARRLAKTIAARDCRSAQFTKLARRAFSAMAVAGSVNPDAARVVQARTAPLQALRFVEWRIRFAPARL